MLKIKNKSRTVFSLICALALILQTAAFTAVHADANIYVYETFDSLSLDSRPSGATCSNKNNYMGVVDLEGDGDKCFKTQITTASDAYLEKKFDSPVKDGLVMDFTVRAENNENSKRSFYIRNSDSQNIHLLTINPKGELLDTDGQVITALSEEKFYHIVMAVDVANNSYDFYVNGRMRGSNIKMGLKTKDITLARIHISGVVEPCSSALYIDNLFIYGGTEPMTKEKLAALNESSAIDKDAVITPAMVTKKMKNAVSFYDGAAKAMVYGTAKYIDSSHSVTPYEKDGFEMIPLAFAVESCGGTVSWDENTKTVTAKVDNRTAVLAEDGNSVTINGSVSKLDTAAETVNGRLFVPHTAAAKILGKEVYSDDTGLIAFSDEADFFNWNTEKRLMSAIVGNMVYERPSGREIVETLESVHPNKEHPRIMAKASDFEIIKERIKVDNTVATWYGQVIKDADSILDAEVQPYTIPDGIRLLQACKRVLSRVETLSFAYKISGDTKYADRAWKEIDNAYEYKDWNPFHTLDTAEMLAAMAIGYDWLYDYLDETQREKIRTNIVEKGFEPLMEDYRDTERQRHYKWSVAELPNNWNTVCNGGAIMAALAIGDEEPYSADILNEAIISLESSVNLFAPDGAWFEGLAYWGYTINYLARAVTSMESALGTDYGFFKAPGIKNTGYYVYDLTGPGGPFNFSDMANDYINAPEIFWIAEKLGDENLTVLRLNDMEERNITGSVRDILWYSAEPDTRKVDMNLDSLYRDAEVVTCEAVGARVILFLQASMQGATTYPILILNAERLCLTRTAADSQWIWARTIIISPAVSSTATDTERRDITFL